MFSRRRLADPGSGGFRGQVPPNTGGNPKTLIRFEALTKSFAKLAAVDDLTLEIRDGEFFCLLGPSGCGKSTLLRMLAGFEAPDHGRILLEGRDIVHDPPHRRPLNMMFQSYALFPHLTASGNIAYGLKQAGVPKREIVGRVDEMLRLVRLPDVGKRYPGQLSGGQRQRVALARALARNPRVLLLDEPLGALDRRLREETQAELKSLQHRIGTTFIMVTHDQDEAMSMADRIGLMDKGCMAQVGPPRELYERPANRFVATFLGDINLAEGKVVGRDGALLTVLTSWSETPLRVAHTASAPVPGGSCTVAIRPEKIAIGSGQDGPNALSGRIVGETFLGGQTRSSVELAQGQVLRISRPSSSATPGLAIGEPVRLTFAADAPVLLP